jgi:KUP system potassium uptake protein
MLYRCRSSLCRSWCFQQAASLDLAIQKMSMLLTVNSAIQISWLCLTFPCLLLAYIGQAAYISRTPSAYSNPFFETVPPGMFYPSLVLSILAAVVASQALITSTFQLLIQLMHSSYFPQIKATYTSTAFHGQVYIPLANWIMMIGTVIVTAVYSNVSISVGD